MHKPSNGGKLCLTLLSTRWIQGPPWPAPRCSWPLRRCWAAAWCARCRRRPHRATSGRPPPPPAYQPAPAPAPYEDAPAGDYDAEVQANEAPPPLPDYDQPPCPEDGYMWTPGYWAWGGGGYYWVPGTWVQPPRVGVLWTPAYWGFVGGVYRFHAGLLGPAYRLLRRHQLRLRLCGWLVSRVAGGSAIHLPTIDPSIT